MPPQYFKETPDCVGLPLDSVQIKICDPETEREVPAGKDGVLWIKGPNLMNGYYQNQELTDRVMKRGWLKTGDIAQIESHGFVKIKGRADDMIIRAGINIYPGELEAEIRRDPRTKDVLIYKIENESTGTQIGMKISGDFSSEKEVRQMCVETLPPYAVPSIIQLLKELPVNGSGKIVRKNGSV